MGEDPVGKRAGPAEQPGSENDSRDPLECLHPVVSIFQVAPHDDRPMMGKEKGLVMFEVGSDRGRHLVRSRHREGDRRDGPENIGRLGEQVVRDRFSCERKGRGDRRVGMHDRLAIRPRRVDRQVKLDLAGRCSSSYRSASIVDDHQVLGAEVPLARPGRGAKEAIGLQAGRQVAFGRSNEAPLPKPTADLAHRRSQPDLGHRVELWQVRPIMRPMPDEPRSLPEIRDEIDRVDAELVRLLSRRAELAREVGRVKDKDQAPYFTPERERQIYARLRESNPGPLLDRQLTAIFREIISAARAAEKPLEVAYWGPPSTFSHVAAIQTFGSSTTLQPQDSIQDVFLAVEHGTVDYGVAPIENSTAGVVPETLDMFPQTNVKICAETYVAIVHHLVSIATDLESIERVYAGPQPAAQCKRWLRANLPRAEIVEMTPTAKAAEKALEDPRGAAIANRFAAETLGIPILVDHIEDNSHNRTRFIVIGYNEPKKTGRDKTSLMFVLRNRPGELYRALGAFVEHGVNLMMIESRPAQRETFEYIFYCDCAGHRVDESIQNALATLKVLTLETTVLGSYPCADPNES